MRVMRGILMLLAGAATVAASIAVAAGQNAQPDKGEQIMNASCTTCHDSHGSNNDRMLVSKLPFLCQRCHVTSRHPPTVYDGFVLNNSSNANKIYARSCVICHQMIHGSNAPSGKALLR